MLFDIESDPLEEHELSERYPDIVRDLAKKLALLRGCGRPRLREVWRRKEAEMRHALVGSPWGQLPSLTGQPIWVLRRGFVNRSVHVSHF